MMGPFGRINVLYTAFSALLAHGKNQVVAFRESGLAGYESRGHGKNKPFTKSHFSNKSTQAGSNKYVPHQGKREIARRVRQDEALYQKYLQQEINRSNEMYKVAPALQAALKRSTPKGVLTHA